MDSIAPKTTYRLPTPQELADATGLWIAFDSDMQPGWFKHKPKHTSTAWVVPLWTTIDEYDDEQFHPSMVDDGRIHPSMLDTAGLEDKHWTELCFVPRSTAHG